MGGGRSPTLTKLQQAILDIVRSRQRNYPPQRGVLPLTIACFLDEYRAQQTVRRYCVQLWQMGLLDRLGGERSRRGYRIPSEQVQNPVTVPPVAAPKLLPMPPQISIVIRVSVKVA